MEIKSGNCQAHVTLKRSETMLELSITIAGEAICECDRCLDDCSIDVDYAGELVVKFSDEIDDYDGEVMWISPSEDILNLTQYIYESIVLSLPYRRVHDEGECNPEMLAQFTQLSEEEFEQLEAQAEEEETVTLDDHNRSILEALKQSMEDGK